MSVHLGKVISSILQEYFGNVIKQIGYYLHTHGSNPLLYIKRGTELPLATVKQGLCVLIKFGLVSFKPNRNANLANYTLLHDRILLILRYPKYINLIKCKFGDESEIMMEEILQHGNDSASEILTRTYNRLVKDHDRTVPLINLRDKFESLCIAKYIQRISLTIKEDNKLVPDTTISDTLKFQFPEIDVKMIHEKMKGGTVKYPDAGIYWCINHDRFHQDMRDKLIVNSVTNKFDENAGEIMRLLLQQMYIRTEPWAVVSNPIPIVEVKDIVKKINNFPQLIAFFDQYVSVINQENYQLIQKVGEASGGSYVIQLKEIFTNFAWETIEQIVMEKFDSKAARIFRLVKSKKYIESHAIQKFAMIPDKEAKSLTYQLLEENFLDIYELKRPVQAGPAKSFTLFHIQLPVVARMVLELCYKSLYNTMTRRSNEEFVNKRILEKKQRVDTILLSMKTSNEATEEQIADIEDMITPPDKEILNNIEIIMEKLNVVELEIDDTIFLLQMFFAYE